VSSFLEHGLVPLRSTDAMRVQATEKSTSRLAQVRAWGHSVSNRVIAAVSIVLASPLFAAIMIALFVTQGREIFYAGARLGKDGKRFTLYKFRTLDTNKAKIITADKVLPANSGIETPIGKFLRASRLDELPQFFNILRGDMNIVGPRPVRPEIAMQEAQKNPFYQTRFQLKPGLVGATQAYMCHGTSKAVRAKFNYSLYRKEPNLMADISLFVRVGLAVLYRSFTLLWSRVVKRKPIENSIARAEALNLYVEQNGMYYPVLAIATGSMTLRSRWLSGPANLVITTAHGGIRRARIMLNAPDAESDPFSSHSFMCRTDSAQHLVSRFIYDNAVVGPRLPRRAQIRRNRPTLAQSGSTVIAAE